MGHFLNFETKNIVLFTIFVFLWFLSDVEVSREKFNFLIAWDHSFSAYCMHDLNDCFTLKRMDKNCSDPTYGAVVINLDFHI